MVGEKAVGMDDGPIFLMGRLQVLQKFLPISLAFKDLLPFIPPGGNVIKGA